MTAEIGVLPPLLMLVAVRAIAPVTGAKAGHEVDLDGTGSKPAKAGETLTYAWSLVGSSSDATLTDVDKSTAKFTATKAGTYKVQLIVTEGSEHSDPQTIDISVL